jgi:hypothetical protein
VLRQASASRSVGRPSAAFDLVDRLRLDLGARWSFNPALSFMNERLRRVVMKMSSAREIRPDVLDHAPEIVDTRRLSSAARTQVSAAGRRIWTPRDANSRHVALERPGSAFPQLTEQKRDVFDGPSHRTFTFSPPPSTSTWRRFSRAPLPAEALRSTWSQWMPLEMPAGDCGAPAVVPSPRRQQHAAREARAACRRQSAAGALRVPGCE